MAYGGAGNTLFGAPAPDPVMTPGFDINDPNAWQNTLLNLTDKSDPNYKNNIANLNATAGLRYDQRYGGYNAARTFLEPEFVDLVRKYATQAALSGPEQDALMQYMEFVTHPDRMSAENRQRLMASVPQLTQQLQNQIAAAGGGQAAKEGAAVSVFNNQNRVANDADAQLFSDQGRANTALGAINVANAATPNLNNLSTLHGIELGTPRNPTGAQVAGGLAGSILGGPLGGSIGNSLFGGGGGGGSTFSNSPSWGQVPGGGGGSGWGGVPTPYPLFG